MRLYKINWYVNGELTETKEEAYWCDSDLEERWNSYIFGVEDILNYDYTYIKDIKLPDDLFDFSNYKF
jgi:hypothetical protein